MKAAGVSLFLMLSSTCPLLADEGKLEQLRNEVRTSNPEAPAGVNHGNLSYPNLDEDDIWGEFLGKLLYYTVISPFAMPYRMLDDDYYSPTRFLSYPYAFGWPGALQPNGSKKRDDQEIPTGWDRLWTFRATLEEGNDFHGMNRLSVACLLDTFTRFGLAGRIDVFRERLPADFQDRLAMGDVNVLFRFAQSERVQFRFGIGTRLLDDQKHTDAGVNLVYGVEYFPLDPITYRVQCEGGNLGHAGVFRVTTAWGAVWKRLEAQLGYDYLQIGNVKLQGPFIGLRLWF
jgi:hypothetical protein